MEIVKFYITSCVFVIFSETPRKIIKGVILHSVESTLKVTAAKDKMTPEAFESVIHEMLVIHIALLLLTVSQEHSRSM